MKDTVLSWKEKATQNWFSYFQIACILVLKIF